MYDDLKELNTEVYVISVDSVFVHKVWAKQEIEEMYDEQLPFPMVADQNGALGRAYGVYDEEGMIDVRGTFLVDPEGNLQAYTVQTPPVGRNFLETIRTIQAYQDCFKNDGKTATPAGWTPGKAVLTPSPELVGNVHKEYNPKTY